MQRPPNPSLGQGKEGREKDRNDKMWKENRRIRERNEE